MKDKFWDVFVSYKSGVDREAAFDLVSALENAGIKCWIAPRDVTATTQMIVTSGEMHRAGYDDAIPYAIERSRAMAVVVSREAMESDHIKDEINLGKDARTPFFPVRIEDIPLVGSFKYHLGRAQWSDCFMETGSARFLNVTAEISGFLGVSCRSGLNRPDPISSDQVSFSDLSKPSCGACGEVNPEEAKFCQACGSRLTTPTENSQDTSAEITDAIDHRPTGYEGTTDAATLTPAEKQRLDYWTQLLNMAKQLTPLHANVKPSSKSYAARNLGSGFTLAYVSNALDSRIDLYINISAGVESRQKSKDAFFKLKQHKDAIEEGFGSILDWQELPDKNACRVCFCIEGGTKSPRESWGSIHTAMVDAMIRLHDALPADIVGRVD